MMDTLVAWDWALFTLLNSSWTSSVQDAVVPVLTDLHTYPLAQFVLFPLLTFLLFWKYRWKAAKALVIAGLAVGLADAFSYRVIKGSIKRDRPAETGVQYQLRTHHHSGPSFPSNHSANSFAVAVFMGLCFPPLRTVLLLVAALVAYSRVYVGVHFPFDVLGGALIGSVIAFALWRLLRGWIERPVNIAWPAVKRGHDT